MPSNRTADRTAVNAVNHAGRGAARASAYAFDNRAAEARTQLAALESFLDPITADRLRPPVLAPGAACWEVGAGGGSVGRLLARATGPTGRVIATDIDTSRLTGQASDNLAIRAHDVRTDPPPGGPFDVIHARLLLLHLPERQRILRVLAGSLAPGGWLVLEEFDCLAPPRALSAPTDPAAKLFEEVVAGMLEVLQERGADLAWAQNVHREMALAGLVDVDTVTHSQSWPGGSSGATLLEVNCRQLEPRLIAAGFPPEQLAAFRELMTDPRFTALSYQFVSTRGRRPAAGAVAAP
jgi:SAM-dependent methyltransferase